MLTALGANFGFARGLPCVFGALFFVACVPGCMIWLGFGAALQRLLHVPARLRAFNIAMALLLAGSVVLFVS